ncbi:unnamed protein product [Leuciscus chuanchicus]
MACDHHRTLKPFPRQAVETTNQPPPSDLAETVGSWFTDLKRGPEEGTGSLPSPAWGEKQEDSYHRRAKGEASRESEGNEISWPILAAIQSALLLEKGNL